MPLSVQAVLAGIRSDARNHVGVRFAQCLYQPRCIRCVVRPVAIGDKDDISINIGKSTNQRASFPSARFKSDNRTGLRSAFCCIVIRAVVINVDVGSW
jgi:hypothetical protein